MADSFQNLIGIHILPLDSRRFLNIVTDYIMQHCYQFVKETFGKYNVVLEYSYEVQK